MPVQADKKPPSMPVKAVRIDDFSGGLNTTINGSLLNKNEAQVAKNVSFEQKGTLLPRKGRKARFSSVVSSHPITGLGVYYKIDGTTRLMIAAYDTLYSDSPHLSIRYDSQDEFSKGVLTERLSATLEPGKLVLDSGITPVVTVGGEASKLNIKANCLYGNVYKPTVDLQVNKLSIYTDTADKAVTYAVWERTRSNPGETPAKYAYTVIVPPTTTVSKSKAWVDIRVGWTLIKDKEYVVCVGSTVVDVICSYPTYTVSGTFATLVGTVAGVNLTSPPEDAGVTPGGYAIILNTAKSSLSFNSDTSQGTLSTTVSRSGSNVSIKKSGVTYDSKEDLSSGVVSGLRNTQEGYLMNSTGYTWNNAIAIAPTWQGLITSMGV